MKRIMLSSLIILVTLIIGITSYRYFFITPYISLQDTNQITIITLPSPPKQKVVTQKDDIKQLVEFFNTTQFSPTLKQSSKGWETKIQIDGTESHTLLLIEGYISFDGDWYSVDDQVMEKMRTLYQTFDYPEQSH